MRSSAVGAVQCTTVMVMLGSSFAISRELLDYPMLTGQALRYAVAALVLAAAVVSLVATFFEVFPLDVYFWMLVAIVTACAAESR